MGVAHSGDFCSSGPVHGCPGKESPAGSQRNGSPVLRKQLASPQSNPLSPAATTGGQSQGHHLLEPGVREQGCRFGCRARSRGNERILFPYRLCHVLKLLLPPPSWLSLRLGFF